MFSEIVVVVVWGKERRGVRGGGRVAENRRNVVAWPLL